MNFTRTGQWAQVSDDGRYTVACVRVKDAYRFEAWHVGAKPAVALGVFDNAEDAREACAKHGDKLLKNARQLGTA